MLKPLWKLIDRLMADRRLVILFLLINIAGSAFGLYYYWEQLMLTPWYLWLAVPDCPLYTFLMVFALLLILLNRPSDTLNTITAVGLSMYGAWTTIVLLYFGEIYFYPTNALMSCGLWISHFGMGLEGFLLIPWLVRAKPVSWALTAAWFAVLDSVDYFYRFSQGTVTMRTHPLALLEYYHLYDPIRYAPLLQKIDSLLYLTYGLSIIFFALMIALTWIYAKDSQKKLIAEKVRT